VAKDNTFLGMTTFHDIQRHSNDTSLTVSDVMNTESFKTAHPDDSVIDMAKMFKNTMIHAIPVTEDNRLLGIVTRSSLIHGLANMDEGGDDYMISSTHLSTGKTLFRSLFRNTFFSLA